MKQVEKRLISLRIDKIGELQQRRVRWHIHEVEGAKLVEQTGEKLVLEVDLNYFDIKRIRHDKVCYFYIKYADDPMISKDSRSRLEWKKLDLKEDVLVNGSKVEIYTALY